MGQFFFLLFFMPIFSLIPDTVNFFFSFTLLDTRYFCFPASILELCSGTQLNYLETAWFFWVLFSGFVRWDQSDPALIIVLYWDKPFWLFSCIKKPGLVNFIENRQVMTCWSDTSHRMEVADCALGLWALTLRKWKCGGPFVGSCSFKTLPQRKLSRKIYDYTLKSLSKFQVLGVSRIIIP